MCVCVLAAVHLVDTAPPRPTCVPALQSNPSIPCLAAERPRLKDEKEGTAVAKPQPRTHINFFAEQEEEVKKHEAKKLKLASASDIPAVAVK